VIPHYDALVPEAAALLEACRAKKQNHATAESCTGGLIAAVLTEVPGSSDVLERGFITYSNAAKTEQLGIPVALIAQHGAVSDEVAEAMAAGALQHSRADLAVSVTGIAGPGGGTVEKPVGLVYLAASRRNGAVAARELRLGDIGRGEIRRATVSAAFALLRELL
jgi:nicotinamide-nucleotide amidase